MATIPLPDVRSNLEQVRRRAAEAVFAKVAGPDGDERRARIHLTEGPRWFADGSPIQAVHGDASMFVGGIRALLLQSLHPLAMAAVAGHSGFRSDPWGRLQRTSYFLAVTTFGAAPDAAAAVDRVRAIHARVTGLDARGRPYAASDPHLLTWVHVAEVDSFLAAHDRYGDEPLDAAGRDRYVAETAVVARALGVLDPPESVGELAEQLAAYRPELEGTADARAAARFLLLRPPLPVAVRPFYAGLAASAVNLLPPHARLALRLPWLPVTEALVVRTTGHLLTRAIRWALTAPADGGA